MQNVTHFTRGTEAASITALRKLDTFQTPLPGPRVVAGVEAKNLSGRTPQVFFPMSKLKGTPMNKTLLSAALIAGFGIAAFVPQAAHAASTGTINFSGKVYADTCTVNVNGAGATVVLPTVATSAFAATANTALTSSATARAEHASAPLSGDGAHWLRGCSPPGQELPAVLTVSRTLATIGGRTARNSSTDSGVALLGSDTRTLPCVSTPMAAST